MTAQKTVTLAVAATVAAGLLFGQVSSSDSEQDWEMFGQRVAGTGGAAGSVGGGYPGERVYGNVFLYNKRTGKSYLYFNSCTSGGKEFNEGCFFNIPVTEDRGPLSPVPKPLEDRSGRAY